MQSKSLGRGCKHSKIPYTYLFIFWSESLLYLLRTLKFLLPWQINATADLPPGRQKARFCCSSHLWKASVELNPKGSITATTFPRESKTSLLIRPSLGKGSLRKNWCYRTARWSEAWNCFWMKAFSVKRRGRRIKEINKMVWPEEDEKSLS